MLLDLPKDVIDSISCWLSVRTISSLFVVLGRFVAHRDLEVFACQRDLLHAECFSQLIEDEENSSPAKRINTCLKFNLVRSFQRLYNPKYYQQLLDFALENDKTPRPLLLIKLFASSEDFGMHLIPIALRNGLLRECRAVIETVIAEGEEDFNDLEYEKLENKELLALETMVPDDNLEDYLSHVLDRGLDDLAIRLLKRGVSARYVDVENYHCSELAILLVESNPLLLNSCVLFAVKEQDSDFLEYVYKSGRLPQINEDHLVPTVSLLFRERIFTAEVVISKLRNYCDTERCYKNATKQIFVFYYKPCEKASKSSRPGTYLDESELDRVMASRDYPKVLTLLSKGCIGVKVKLIHNGAPEEIVRTLLLGGSTILRMQLLDHAIRRGFFEMIKAYIAKYGIKLALTLKSFNSLVEAGVIDEEAYKLYSSSYY